MEWTFLIALLTCLIQLPYFWNERDGEKRSEDYKEIFFDSVQSTELARAVLVSNTFYFYFLSLSDSYHCGRELVLGFLVEFSCIEDAVKARLAALGRQHEQDLFKHSRRRRIEYRATGWIEYDEFYPRLSKPIIDEIDRTLAQHYGFTHKELDFIINYDIKYRMGVDSDAEEEWPNIPTRFIPNSMSARPRRNPHPSR